MGKKLIILLVLVAFVNIIWSCSKIITVYPEEKLPRNGTIVAAVMPDGSKVEFSDPGGHYDENYNIIIGTDYRGNSVRVSLDDILYLQVKVMDPLNTFVATIGVLALAALTVVIIIAATKESCPFIYSWDGDKYVLDAEPLGGAICEGLRRVDVSRMDYLRPDDGQYRIMIRNEVAETQYIDHIHLRVVDHSPEYRVFTDTTDYLHFVKNPVEPYLAMDENQNDILPFVKESDGLAWRSKIPVNPKADLPFERHHLVFKFPRPDNADRARLLFNIGTPLWGSNMIREMLALRGEGLNDWYEAIEARGPEYDNMFSFIEREELWYLNILVEESDSLVSHGYIPGAGPLVIEDRVVPLDLSGVKGDTLTIRFNPPYGFWNIDYLAVQYNEYPNPEEYRIMPRKVVDFNGDDITDKLSALDSNYYVMPEIGDKCELTFDAPPGKEGMARTVILESSGYYKIHIDDSSAAQPETLTKIGMIPGESVRFSYSKYIEFLKQWQSDN